MVIARQNNLNVSCKLHPFSFFSGRGNSIHITEVSPSDYCVDSLDGHTPQQRTSRCILHPQPTGAIRRTIKSIETMRNLIKEINTWAVPYTRYEGPSLECTTIEFGQMYKNRRKLMTPHKSLHPRDDTGRIYGSRNERGSEVVSIGDRVVLFGLVWFYSISTIVGYLMPNPLYTYILNVYDLVWLGFMAYQPV